MAIKGRNQQSENEKLTFTRNGLQAQIDPNEVCTVLYVKRVYKLLNFKSFKTIKSTTLFLEYAKLY